MTVALFFQAAELGDVIFIFSPPIREFTEKWRKETPPDERRFHNRFRGEARATNVHKLIDGSYTEAEGIAPELIEVTYRGSTTVVVDADEAASLEAAGYEVEASG